MKPIDRKRIDLFVCPSEMEPVDPKDESLGQKPKEGHSVFKLRGLGKRTRAFTQDIAAYVRTEGEEERTIIETRTGSVRYWNVKYGLIGVENFEGWASEPDPNGHLPSDEKVPTDAFLDSIPDDTFSAISARVAELSTLTVEDAEKSSPQSTSSSTTPSPLAAASAEPSA